MSTSLLYHGFGVVGYNYIRTDYQEGKIVFTLSRISGDQVLELSLGSQLRNTMMNFRNQTRAFMNNSKYLRKEVGLTV